VILIFELKWEPARTTILLYQASLQGMSHQAGLSDKHAVPDVFLAAPQQVIYKSMCLAAEGMSQSVWQQLCLDFLTESTILRAFQHLCGFLCAY
jgi:hypothetical protein